MKGGSWGWDDLSDALRRGTIRRAKAMAPQAHERVGLVFRRMTIQQITIDQPFAPNSPITVALKGSTTPLVGGGSAELGRSLPGGGSGGDLVGSITYRVEGWKAVVLGVKSPRLSRGSGRYLYEVLHNGATWVPTDRQRRAMFQKLKRTGRVLRRVSGAAKGTWTIPPRPFLRVVFEDPQFGDAVRDIYTQLVRAAWVATKQAAAARRRGAA